MNKMNKGYKSTVSKSYELTKANLKVKVKGLRNFWSFLYGVNKSGSPKRFSSLMERVNNQRQYAINGWDIIKGNESPSKDLPWLIRNSRLDLELNTNDPNSLFRELFSHDRDNSQLANILNNWEIYQIK